MTIYPPADTSTGTHVERVNEMVRVRKEEITHPNACTSTNIITITSISISSTAYQLGSVSQEGNRTGISNG
jgi:hypothetical protein